MHARSRFLSLAAVAFASVGSGCAPEPSADEAVVSVQQALTGAAGLSITGSSNITNMTVNHAQEFDGLFHLSNSTGKAVTIQRQMFFFAAPGGYAYPGPTFDNWWPSVPAGATMLPAGPFAWGFTAPVSHLVIRVDGRTSAGTPLSTLKAVPVLATGRAAPAASPYTTDVVVGVQGALEVLSLAGGQRWLGVTGSVVDTTGSAAGLPVVTAKARNSSGTTVANLQVLLTGPSDPPIRAFIAWTPLSATAQVTDLRLTASHNVGGTTLSQTRTIAVASASPLPISSPVAGTWAWNNGPGETVWHAHSGGPEARYAYDMGIYRMVNGRMQSYSGDPNVNASFFCWGQPIRAAMGGVVRQVQDQLPDNNGMLQDRNEGNNEITIEHPNGVFTRYAHMRQFSARVRVGDPVAAGTVIAEVGNAGASSEPHLHFHAYKLDATGRVAGIPVAVNGLHSEAGIPLAGVPRGGTRYTTP